MRKIKALVIVLATSLLLVLVCSVAAFADNMDDLSTLANCEVGQAVTPEYIEAKSTDKYSSGYYISFDISEPGWYLVSANGELKYEDSYRRDTDGNYVNVYWPTGFISGSFSFYIYRYDKGRYWVRIDQQKKLSVSRIPELEPGQKVTFNIDPLKYVVAAIMTTSESGQYYFAQEAEVTNNKYYTFSDQFVLDLQKKEQVELKHFSYGKEPISYKKRDRLKVDYHDLYGGPLYKKTVVGKTFNADNNGVYLYYAYNEDRRGIKVCPMLTADKGGDEFRTNLVYADIRRLVDRKCNTIVPHTTIFSANKEKLFNDEVLLSGRTLRPGEDFTISYSNRNVGRSKVTLTGKGDYTGKLEYSVDILPLGTSIKTAKASGNSIKVTWKKQAKKMAKSRITGYQIQYSTDSGFRSKNRKEIRVKGYNRTSTVVDGLKSGKTYYFRICTYKKVGNRYYYSPWKMYARKGSGSAIPVKTH